MNGAGPGVEHSLLRKMGGGCDMDKRRAQGLIKFALVYNIVAVLISAGVIVWTQIPTLYPAVLVDWCVYFFMPFGPLGVALVAVLVFLIVFMAYRRSRVAAVLLLLMYGLDRLYILILLYGFSDTYRATWKVVSMVWLMGFAPGIVGTFAFHRPDVPGTKRRLTSLPIVVALLLVVGVGVAIATAA